VEPVGNEIFLHADFHGDTLLARIGPEPLPRVGATYRLRLRLDRAHAFAADSGENLLSTTSSPNS
jgi:hypothetical protein